MYTHTHMHTHTPAHHMHTHVTIISPKNIECVCAKCVCAYVLCFKTKTIVTCLNTQPYNSQEDEVDESSDVAQ